MARNLAVEEHEGKRNDGKGGSCNNLRGCVLEEDQLEWAEKN